VLALNKGAAITSVVIAACHTVLIEAPYLWFAGLARGSIA
jgi:hypothetical protein